MNSLIGKQFIGISNDSPFIYGELIRFEICGGTKIPVLKENITGDEFSIMGICIPNTPLITSVISNMMHLDGGFSHKEIWTFLKDIISTTADLRSTK